MKKIGLVIVAAALFAACNTKVNADDKKSDAQPAASATTEQVSATPKVKDPVCGMEKENTWTDHIVKGTDTSWFCSPHCKETFEKNPDKYAKKATETKG